METIMTNPQRKGHIKLTPEQMFNIYMECNAPGVPVKTILQRHNLKPWDLVAIRKKIKAAALETLSNPGKPGRKQRVVPAQQYQRTVRELQETKDALAAVGHELALLKKRTD